MKNAVIYIHGKGGSADEADHSCGTFLPAFFTEKKTI